MSHSCLPHKKLLPKLALDDAQLGSANYIYIYIYTYICTHIYIYIQADDLMLMAKSEESLREKIVKRKSGLEAKGLKMNTGKMKIMFSCSMKDRMEEKGKWPCSTCGAMWCTCGDLMMVIMCGVTGYRLLI